MGKVGCDIWEKWVRWAKKTNTLQSRSASDCASRAHSSSWKQNVGGIDVSIPKKQKWGVTYGTAPHSSSGNQMRVIYMYVDIKKIGGHHDRHNLVVQHINLPKELRPLPCSRDFFFGLFQKSCVWVVTHRIKIYIIDNSKYINININMNIVSQ